MTRFDNNAEGGTNGATVTTSDVASGTAWTNVVGSPTWTTATPIDGSVSVLFSASTSQFLGWDDTTNANAAIMVKFRIPSAPSGAVHRLIDIRSSGGSIGNLTMGNGVTTLTANSGTGATTAVTVSLTPGSDYFATLVFTGLGTASSAVTLKVYDANGILLDTKSASAGTTALPMLRARYGRPTTGETGLATGLIMDRWAQDIGSSTEILPPVSGPAPLTTTDSFSAAGFVGQSAPLSTTDSFTASGFVGLSAPLVTTDAFTAAGAVGVTTTAPLSTTDGLAGTGRIGVQTTAPLATTDGFTAAGTVASAAGSAPLVTTDALVATGRIGVLTTAPLATTDSLAGTGRIGVLTTAPLATSDLFVAAGAVGAAITGDAPMATLDLFTAAGFVGTSTATTGFAVSGSSRTEPFVGQGVSRTEPFVGQGYVTGLWVSK
jgi:hypothetical protein